MSNWSTDETDVASLVVIDESSSKESDGECKPWWMLRGDVADEGDVETSDSRLELDDDEPEATLGRFL